MTDETQQQPHNEPEKPPRQRPGRKPGQANKKAPATTSGPVRNVSMNPAPGGNVLVKIEMELPLQLGIELVSAAANIQTTLDQGPMPMRVATPFPKAAPPPPGVKTRWQAGNSATPPADDDSATA